MQQLASQPRSKDARDVANRQVDRVGFNVLLDTLYIIGYFADNLPNQSLAWYN